MNHCLEGLLKISAGDFSREELNQMLKDLNDERLHAEEVSKAANTGMDKVLEDLKAAGADYLKKKDLEERIARFDALRDLKILSHSTYAFDRFKEARKASGKAFTPKDYVKSFLTSINEHVFSGKFSIDAQKTAAVARGTAKILNGLDDIGNGALEFYEKNKYELEVLKVMNGKLTGNGTLDRMGDLFRNILDGYKERFANEAIFLDDAENYFPVTHNKQKLLEVGDTAKEIRDIRRSLRGDPEKENKLGQIAEQRWKDFVLKEYLNLKKTFKGKAGNAKYVDKFLHESYLTLTDNKNIAFTNEDLRGRLTHRRVLIPKSEEAVLAYSKKYGSGSLFTDLENAVRRNEKNLTIIHNLGTKPYNMLTKIGEHTFKRLKKDGVDFTGVKLRKVVSEGRYLLKTIDGTIYDPSTSAAVIGGNIRAIRNISLAPLTGAHGLTVDYAPVINQMARYNQSYFKSFFKAYGKLFSVIRNTDQINNIAKVFNITRESYIGSFARFGGDESNPLLGRVLGKSLKIATRLSFNHIFNFAKRIAIASEMGRTLALHKDILFEKLPAIIKSDLTDYGITSELWDAVRKNTIKIQGVPELIAEDSAQNLSDTAVKNYLKKTGVDATNYTSKALDNVRNQIGNRWGTYFNHQISYGVVSEDAGGKAFWMFGLEPQTKGAEWAMEGFKMLHFYKSYITGFMTKPLGRAVTEGGFVPLVKFGAAMLSMSAMDVVFHAELLGQKVKSPYDFLIKTVEYSNILGLYGQLLPHGRPSGEDLYRSILGPALSLPVDTVVNLQKLMTGNLSRTSAYYYLKGNLPIVNNFFTANRVMNYLLWDSLYEFMTGKNPHKHDSNLFLGG